MRDSVAQAQRLIGARLRDSQRREGRVVGVDQTREPPALLIVWEGQVQAARVPLSLRELDELVRSCDMERASRRDAAPDGTGDGVQRGPTQPSACGPLWENGRRTGGQGRCQ